VRNSFVIWLNQHTEAGEQLAALIVSNAAARLMQSTPATRS
jgi:topoisomerase-4 subunit B